MKRKQNGFTLVETLVAISILTLSIMGTFTAVQNGIQNSTIAKDQTTAFYLAQEAMEFIKNKRDENALNYIDNSWSSWLTDMSENASDPCWFGHTCMIVTPRVDSLSGTIIRCSGGFGTCDSLMQHPATGLFGYNIIGGNPTIFKREIQFVEIMPNEEVEVTIRMSWTSRWGTKSFQVTEMLLNRQ